MSTDGYYGFVGYASPLGLIGEQGISGDVGDTGFDGRQGAQGVSGVLGVEGFQSVIGLDGATGFQDVFGLQGLQGLQTMGGTGNDGIVGFEGRRGPAGFQEKIGIQGSQGCQSSQAQPGPQGNYGVRGFTGLDATAGWQGSDGPLNGIQGLEGVQGVTGFQGSQGQLGARGGEGHLSPYGILDLQIFNAYVALGSEIKSIPINGSTIGNLTTNYELGVSNALATSQVTFTTCYVPYDCTVSGLLFFASQPIPGLGDANYPPSIGLYRATPTNIVRVAGSTRSRTIFSSMTPTSWIKRGFTGSVNITRGNYVAQLVYSSSNNFDNSNIASFNSVPTGFINQRHSSFNASTNWGEANWPFGAYPDQLTRDYRVIGQADRLNQNPFVMLY